MQIPNWTKELWADPVWSKVIGGLILLAVPSGAAVILQYFTGMLSGLPAICTVALQNLSSFLNLGIPVWGLALSIATAIFIRTTLRSLRSGRTPETPDWIRYTEDTMRDLIWK